MALERKRQLLDPISKDLPVEARRATVMRLWRGEDESEEAYRQRITGDVNFNKLHWQGWCRNGLESEDKWLARQRHNFSSNTYSVKRFLFALCEACYT